MGKQNLWNLWKVIWLFCEKSLEWYHRGANKKTPPKECWSYKIMKAISSKLMYFTYCGTNNIFNIKTLTFSSIPETATSNDSSNTHSLLGENSTQYHKNIY